MSDAPFIDAFVAAVPLENRAMYEPYAAATADLFREHGALRVTECWQSDVPDGVVTSFPLAVKRAPGEAVVMGFVEWPSKAVRDAAMPKVIAAMDTSSYLSAPPFDTKRMIFAGFDVLFQRG